jgi:cystathionine beta-lyase
MKFNTKAIHGGQHPDPSTAVMPPISNNDLCTNKPWTSYGEYEYSRTANPTRTALENALASIENGARGLAFSSGLAATDCLMRD